MNIIHALHGEPKRLSRNYRRRNGGNVIVNVLISFHSRDVPCILSRLFVRPGFRMFCVHLAVHYLAVYLILRILIKLSSTLKVLKIKVNVNKTEWLNWVSCASTRVLWSQARVTFMILQYVFVERLHFCVILNDVICAMTIAHLVVFAVVWVLKQCQQIN